MTTQVYRRAYLTTILGEQLRFNGQSVPIRQTITEIADATRDGVPNPRHKAQIALGMQAGTDFSATKLTVKTRPYVFYEKRDQNGLPSSSFGLTQWRGRSYLSNSDFTTGSWPTVDLGAANNRALTALVKDIRDARTAMQGGVFLGEIGEVVSMIRNPARAFRRGLDEYFTSLKKVKRIRSKKLKQRALAETWLEYSFGWTPLISDTKDAFELAHRVQNRYASERVHGLGESESSTFWGFASFGQVTSFRIPWFQGQKVTVRYFGGVSTGQDSLSVAELAGLDLSNFVPTAWELVPWSFVVDYFTNVGDMISCLTLRRSGVRWLMKDVITERWYIAAGGTPNWGFSSPWPGLVRSALPGYTEGVHRSIVRTRYAGTLVPDFRFEIPGLSSLKWINLSALAASSRSIRPLF